MKFNKLLKELRINEGRTLDRYEIFLQNRQLVIKSGSSNVPVSLEKWISQDNKIKKLEVLQKLCSKLLGKEILPDWATIKKILETIFSELNSIPDFSIVKDQETGEFRDIVVNDNQEYKAAIANANFRQMFKGIV